jgi:hypothetical protein
MYKYEHMKHQQPTKQTKNGASSRLHHLSSKTRHTHVQKGAHEASASLNPTRNGTSTTIT